MANLVTEVPAMGEGAMREFEQLTSVELENKWFGFMKSNNVQ
ncbi:hypothetical protein [Paenibacillus popilliae]|nr:hypothetical protein [Paenibacillus sp. SDF0028]